MIKKNGITINNNNRLLFVHHWDCDGLCSATLLYKLLNEINPSIEIKTMMPKIGNYFLTENDLDKIMKEDPDHLFVIDMALPETNILDLEKTLKNIYIFDHHKQARINKVVHINPTIDKGANNFYPSTGWVLNDFFNREQEILSVLGAIGDQGEKVKNNDIVKKVLKENGLTFDQCNKIVKVIDSNYIINSSYDINKTINFLKGNSDNIGSILQNNDLTKNSLKIEKEIIYQIKKGFIEYQKEKIIIKKFKSRFNIISDLARILAKKFPGYIIVVINDLININNIYFRSAIEKIDLTPIIDLAQINNYNAGGKNEVVGVFLPKEDMQNFIKEVFKLFGINLQI